LSTNWPESEDSSKYVKSKNATVRTLSTVPIFASIYLCRVSVLFFSYRETKRKYPVKILKRPRDPLWLRGRLMENRQQKNYPGFTPHPHLGQPYFKKLPSFWEPLWLCGRVMENK
jgi:hypothetical protein